MRTESEFLEAIDCRFPFGDRAACLVLVEEACAISANAAFAVVDEIVRPPRSAEVAVVEQRELLELVFARLQHPLVDVIRPLAELRLDGREATVGEGLAALRAIARHPGQYAALGIASLAADDRDGQLDRADEAIRSAWASSSAEQRGGEV